MNYLDNMVKELFKDVLAGKKNIPTILEDNNGVIFLEFSPKVKIYRGPTIHVIVEEKDYKLLREEYSKLTNTNTNITPKEIIDLNILFDKVLLFSKSRQNDFEERKIIELAFSEIK